jgi:hypothetical protein
MTGKAPARELKFDQSTDLLAKQELGGNCVPKQSLGTRREKIGTP